MLNVRKLRARMSFMIYKSGKMAGKNRNIILSAVLDFSFQSTANLDN